MAQSLFLNIIAVFVCLRVHACVCQWQCECMEAGGSLLWQPVLSFHHVDLGDGVQFVRLGGERLYSVSHLTTLGPTLKKMFSMCGGACL